MDFGTCALILLPAGVWPLRKENSLRFLVTASIFDNKRSSIVIWTRRLRPLGEGLMSLVHALGPAFQHTVIVVMSEFGRTVRENGNGGTDHGHGNVMWVAGGAVRGGKVYGIWPGLGESELYQGRDLAITTDFRAVLSVVIRRHMEIGGAGMRAVLPGFSSHPGQLDQLIEV